MPNQKIATRSAKAKAGAARMGRGLLAHVDSMCDVETPLPEILATNRPFRGGCDAERFLVTARNMGPRTLVVVPAFNEAGNVGRLLAEIRALPDRLDVVVVDDGSPDATAGAAAAGGARVLRLPFNCGIGAAVQ